MAGELGGAGCEVVSADLVAECAAEVTLDRAPDAIDFAELTTRRVGVRCVSVTVDLACRRDLEADACGDDFAVVLGADFDVDFVADRDVPDASDDSVSVADADDDGVAVGHGGVVSLCSRCTMRYASDLLLAVMPDSTCERHAGLRSDIFRPVLRYTSENFNGPNDAFTPW